MAEIDSDNVMTLMYAKAWLAQAATNLKNARSEWAFASKEMEVALTEIASHQDWQAIGAHAESLIAAVARADERLAEAGEAWMYDRSRFSAASKAVFAAVRHERKLAGWPCYNDPSGGA